MKHLIIALSTIIAAVALAGDIVVYPMANPLKTTCSTLSGCPGGYCGYVNYLHAPGSNWGYRVDTNATSFGASYTNGPYIDVQCVGYFGDINCDWTNVSIAMHPAIPTSPMYRFSVYYKSNNVPMTTNLPLVLHGFLPN